MCIRDRPSAALAAEGDISLSANYKAEDGSLTISWNTLSARGYRLGSATVNDKTVNDPQTKDGNGVTSFTVTDFGAVVGTNTIAVSYTHLGKSHLLRNLSSAVAPVAGDADGRLAPPARGGADPGGVR